MKVLVPNYSRAMRYYYKTKELEIVRCKLMYKVDILRNMLH